MSRKIKILIIEDDPVTMVMLEYLAKMFSLEAVTATDVAAANAAIILEQPQIAILDLMLPHSNGIEMLAEIRESRLPIGVAMIAGNLDQSKLCRGNAWTPDEVFTEPLDFDALGNWLKYQKARVEFADSECLIA